MARIRFTKWFVSLVLLISVAVSSCQKDDSAQPVKSGIDSTALSLINTPGNFLAGKGTLKITIEDSTYIFDAAKDSIAFINVNKSDNKYFGITAINKAHTMSFGISSIGFAAANNNTDIAGSQLLLMPDNQTPLTQYTLTKYAGQQDFGKITLEQYNHQNVIAKGTFFTFLANDDKSDTPFSRVEGSFELQLK